MKWTVESLLEHTKPNNDCLEWTRCLTTDGYPRLTIGGNCNVKAHRLMYELVSGENIAGLVVRHSCDNPKCINPNHLLIGTHQDNMDDRRKRDRHPRVIRKHHVDLVRELSNSVSTHRKIASIVGIDYRRVGEILNGKRDDFGRLVY